MKKSRQIALLRGINVGGKNKLPMKTLVAYFEEAGCKSVRHYIQSGNVVFDAEPPVMKTLAEVISARIRSELSLEVPLVLRSASAYEKALRKNPFVEEGAPEDSLFVAFLRDKPKAADVKALDPERSPPDRFLVRGSEVFMTLPNGAARTKITAPWLDRQLKTVSTFRNWRTSLKLLEMASED